jgi:hypothetical protein
MSASKGFLIASCNSLSQRPLRDLPTSSALELGTGVARLC